MKINVKKIVAWFLAWVMLLSQTQAMYLFPSNQTTRHWSYTWPSSWVNVSRQDWHNITWFEDINKTLKAYYWPYNECYDMATGKDKIKSFNLANSAWGVGIMATKDIVWLNDQKNKNIISQTDYDKYVKCQFWGFTSGRFLAPFYKSPASDPQGYKTDIVKDFFVEWGFYRLASWGDNYNYINSFYLFNSLKGNNDVDMWIKSFIEADNSLSSVGLDTQNTTSSYTEDVKKKQIALIKWLKENNLLRTKWLGYSFQVKKDLNTQNMDSLTLNKELKKYFSNATKKSQFFTMMNGVQSGNVWTITLDNGAVIEVTGFQMNPYWKFDPFTFTRIVQSDPLQWSSPDVGCWSSACTNFENQNSLYASEYIGWAMPYKFASYHEWNHNDVLDDNSFYTYKLLNPLPLSWLQGMTSFVSKENNWIKARFSGWNRVFDFKEMYTAIANYWKNEGLSYPPVWINAGVTKAQLRWYMSSTNRTAILKNNPSGIFSNFGLMNYLYNRQFTWETYRLNDDDWFFKNGTVKHTFKLNKGVYLNSLMSITTIVNDFWEEAINEKDPANNFSINYGIAYTSPTTDKQATHNHLMLVDAFRGSYNPTLYKLFDKAVFTTDPWFVLGSTTEAFVGPADFIKYYKKYYNLYGEDSIDNAKEEYNNEKWEQPLKVIAERNLYGHYRNIKDWDSIVPKNMQIMGNIPTQYILSTYGSDILAMENMSNDANAYENTKKDYTYNVIKWNTTDCNVYWEAACIGKYWEVMGNPNNLISYNGKQWGYVEENSITPTNNGISFYYSHYLNSTSNSQNTKAQWTNYTAKMIPTTFWEMPRFEVKWDNGAKVKMKDLHDKWKVNSTELTYDNMPLTYGNFSTMNGMPNYDMSRVMPVTTRTRTNGTNLTGRRWSTLNPFESITEWDNFISNELSKWPNNVNMLERMANDDFAPWKPYFNATMRNSLNKTNYYGSANIIDLFYVGAGAKTGVSQTVEIRDSNNVLMGTLWDYDFWTETPKSIEVKDKNNTLIGRIPKKYRDDFEKVESNLITEKNGKKIHTLPFGWTLYNTVEDLNINSMNWLNKKKPAIFTNGDENSQLKYANNKHAVYLYEGGLPSITTYEPDQNLSKVKIVPISDTRRFAFDENQKNNPLWSKFTIPSILPNSKKIAENNSFGTFYMKNTYNKRKTVNFIINNNTLFQKDNRLHRGVSFGLNAPISITFKDQEEVWQFLSPYIHLEKKDYMWQFGETKVQITTSKNIPDEKLLPIEDKVYRKPFWFISFDEDEVFSQAKHDTGSANHLIGLNPTVYQKNWDGTYKIDPVTKKLVVDQTATDNKKHSYLLKDKYAEGFFKATTLDLPPQLPSSPKEKNLEAFINALALNFINNHWGLEFTTLKKTWDVVKAKLYYYLDTTKNQYYFIFKVTDDSNSITKWDWYLPIKLDGKTGKLKIYSKVISIPTSTRQTAIFNSATAVWPTDLELGYYFRYSSDKIGSLSIERSDVKKISDNANTQKQLEAFFSSASIAYETPIFVSLFDNPTPTKTYDESRTAPRATKSILGFWVYKDIDVILFNETTMSKDTANLDKWKEPVNVQTESDPNPIYEPYEPSDEIISWVTAFQWYTQYLMGISKSYVIEERRKAIQDFNNGNLTQQQYDDLKIEDWEKDNIDNKFNNVWMYKLNYTQKKAITVLDIKNYNTIAPTKQFIKTVSWEWGSMFLSNDESFKHTTKTLDELKKYIPSGSPKNDILSNEYYDVKYSIKETKPILYKTDWTTSGNVKASIDIITNFNQTKGIGVEFDGTAFMADRITAELNCDGRKHPIDIKSNFGIWATNDIFSLYSGDTPKKCSVDLTVKLPESKEIAYNFGDQTFKIWITLDNNEPTRLPTKYHEFTTRPYNVIETVNIDGIEKVPECRIVAKTKSTGADNETVATWSITERTGVVELDVWYRNPELKSENNWNPNKTLLWVKLDLKLTGNAKFENYNAEYYQNLMEKNILKYKADTKSNSDYVKKLFEAMKKTWYKYKNKEISLFLASDFKKNRFYGKTTFLVTPENWNLDSFNFSVTGDCTFQYFDGSQDKRTSDNTVRFNYQKNDTIDNATFHYYNPADKHNGTLYSSGYSKTEIDDEWENKTFFVKQYYPSILSIAYNHIAPAANIDYTSPINWNDNWAWGGITTNGLMSNLGVWCLHADKKANSPQNWVNGDAASCMASGKWSAYNYPINHPAKWGSLSKFGLFNIGHGTWEDHNSPKKFQQDHYHSSWDRGSTTRETCHWWTNNNIYPLECWKHTHYSTTNSISENWVQWGEKIWQGYGGYYYLGLDGTFEIDKKVVGIDWQWTNKGKAFFDKIIPVCLGNAEIKDGRLKILSLAEKSSVNLVDNGGEFNNVFYNAINQKVCNVDFQKIKLFPSQKDNLYTYKGKTINDENVVDKITGMPFFMHSDQKWQIPDLSSITKANASFYSTGVKARLDWNGVVNLFLHPELLKAIQNNPQNVSIEMRFVDENMASAINYWDTTPWTSWNQIQASPTSIWQFIPAPITQDKSWKVKVMWRIGFKLNLAWIKWPQDIKKHPLYLALDDGIKNPDESRLVDMQMPILSLSSYAESFSNGTNELNASFLEKEWAKTIEQIRTSRVDNFNVQAKYKKFAATSYRTGHNTTINWSQFDVRCAPRSWCRSWRSDGVSSRTYHYNASNQATNYIRWFTKKLSNLQDVISDNVIHHFYPYTDNTTDQIKNKTVLIDGIPSIKNIGDNQLVYQGICNVCNQYRGNIFEQHPIGTFNPEHKEKGSNQNIFDYYLDGRNFTQVDYVPWEELKNKTLMNISGAVVTDHWKKKPYVMRVNVPDKVEVAQILPASVNDKQESAVKYKGRKAIVITKNNSKNKKPTATLISSDIIPDDYKNLGATGKKPENELVLVTDGDLIIGADVNYINAVLVVKGNLIIMPSNTSLKIHGGAMINGKIINYRTNIADVNTSSYSKNYKSYLKNLDLFDLKYPVLMTIDPRYASSEIFTYLGSVSKSVLK